MTSTEQGGEDVTPDTVAIRLAAARTLNRSPRAKNHPPTSRVGSSTYTPRERKTVMPRERDLVFEAVCAACHLDYTDLTKSERGRVNRAAKELRDKAPSDILRRGEAAWSRYASMGVTPQTLTKCWTALGEAPGGGDERTTRPGFLTRRRMTA